MVTDKKNKMIDDLVNQLADIVTNTEKLSNLMKILSDTDSIQKGNLGELIDLKERVADLEKKVNGHLNNFKIFAVEIERELNEKVEKNLEEYEQDIFNLQNQLNNLRTSLIQSRFSEGKIKKSEGKIIRI